MSFIEDIVNKAKDMLATPEPAETRAIKSTSFDRYDYDRVVETVPAVQREIDTLADTIDFVKDFMGDVHSTFYKVEPKQHAKRDIVERYQGNAEIINQMLQMPEVSHLRQHSVSDTYGTAMAMVAMKDVALETAQKVQEARSEAEKAAEEAAKRAEENAQAMQALLDQMGQEDPNMLGPSGDEFRAQQLQAQMDQFAQNQAEQQQAQQQAQDAAQNTVEANANQIRSSAKAADQELTEEQELCSAFGVDPGTLQQMDVAQRIELAKTLRNNRLAQFTKLLGQFKTVQQAESRKRVINASSEVHGVTQSAYLERMVAGEFLNFADESLETLMLLRWTEHMLNTYDVRGKEKLGQGPIICVVDESGSMGAADVAGGTREAWSKALALAMCDQARRRNRDFHYLGFGSPGQLHHVKFPKGQAAIEKVIAMTEHFFSGGTHYEGPLMRALDIIEKEFDRDAAHKGKPDIVFISDDEYGNLDETFLAEYRRVKEKASIRTYGIAVGCSAGGAMKQLSDNVRAITELVESDPRKLGDLFRTI
jgi:uncharacterized protein with von Willebrand factor type A (vWA) domain